MIAIVGRFLDFEELRAVLGQSDEAPDTDELACQFPVGSD